MTDANAGADARPKKPGGDLWRQRVFNWSNLRGIGESRTAQISALAPFFGFAIIYHAEAQVWLGQLGGALGGNGVCGAIFGFDTRLHLFFLGATLIGAGALVYRMLAPGVVRTYRLPSDYVERELPFMTARNLRSMCVTVHARNPRVGRMLRRDAPWLVRQQAESDLLTAQAEASKPENEFIGVDVLRSYYNVLNRWTLRWAIYVTFALFGAGAALAALPGLDFTWRVLCVIAGRLFQ